MGHLRRRVRARHRPMRPEWARDLRDKCRREAVAFFFKQWGGLGTPKVGVGFSTAGPGTSSPFGTTSAAVGAPAVSGPGSTSAASPSIVLLGAVDRDRAHRRDAARRHLRPRQVPGFRGRAVARARRPSRTPRRPRLRSMSTRRPGSARTPPGPDTRRHEFPCRPRSVKNGPARVFIGRDQQGPPAVLLGRPVPDSSANGTTRSPRRAPSGRGRPSSRRR